MSFYAAKYEIRFIMAQVRTKNGRFIRSIGNLPSTHRPIEHQESTETESKIIRPKFEGRRIFEIDEVIRQLREGCKSCGDELNLLHASSERVIGLASVFTVDCSVCGLANTITTSKVHKPAKSKYHDESRNVYDVNTKAALGKLQ